MSQTQKNIEAIYPLTPMQQGMLFHSLDAPGSGVYINQLHITLRDLNVERFKQVWQKVVERHALLRTLFVWENRQQPLQVVRRTVTLRWTELDWRGRGPGIHDSQDERLAALLQEERGRDFALGEAPLMRCTLVRRTEQSTVFVWTYHHLISDGWSLAVLFKEIFTLYDAAQRGDTLSLPTPRPFGEYVSWLQKQDRASAEGFWRRYLKEFVAPTPLIAAGARAGETASGLLHAEQDTVLPEALLAALRDTARAHQLTLNTLFMGAWALLLSRYSGAQDVVFGTVVAGRPPTLPGVEAMVGVFINTLPLRVQLDEDAQLSTWLEGIQSQQAERERFGYAALVDIQKWSELLPSTRLFESVAAFENYPIDAGQQHRAERAEVGASDQTDLPLELLVLLEPATSFKLGYDARRFTADTIRRLSVHYQTILAELAAGLTRHLRDVQMLPGTELHSLLVEWNQTATAYPRERSIHALFEEQVRRAPDAVAVCYGDEQLTYSELNGRANRLARYLAPYLAQDLARHPSNAERAPRPGAPLVGLCTERSLDMIVGMLAILKAGGAYVPLDADYPRERLSFMLLDTQAPVVLTQARLRDKLPETGARIVAMDTLAEELAALSEEDRDAPVAPTQRAYVIYTSGSTGQPKGVVVPHRAVVRLVKQSNYVELTPADHVAQASNASFDAATFEIWGSLLSGAQLHGIDRDDLLAPPQLAARLRQQGITVFFLTTALFNQVVSLIPDAFSSLRCLMVGGDAMEPRAVRDALRHGPPRHLLNVYGPTENTTFTLWHEVTQVPDGATSVPIGRPISNGQAYILDAQLRPVPVGVVGELYLGGDGLAEGYLNRPELDAEKFICRALTPQSAPVRLYRTGDLARFCQAADQTGDAAVVIEFIGRIDTQVKLRGFRVELGEIEAVLALHPVVRAAVVVVIQESGSKKLIAYVTTQDADGSPARMAELREYLQAKLPAYMVPAVLVGVESMPITHNGKIDRKALAERRIKGSETCPAAPVAAGQTAIERSLVEIWKEVLRVEQVGVHDGFFDLGGDSILSIQIVSRARRAGLHFTSKQLFQKLTIAELAKVIDLDSGPAPLSQAQVTGGAPLTPIQRWFLAQEPAQPHHFNQSTLLWVAPDTSVALLRTAVAALLGHHDALRLRFRRTASGWEQTHAAASVVSIEEFDLACLDPAAQAEAMASRLAALQGSLQIEKGPLLCAALFRLRRLGADRSVLFLGVHHLAIDGVSWRILLDDLQTAYQQARRGEAVALPAKTTSFQAWARWLTEHGVAMMQPQSAGWCARLPRVVAALPTDHATGDNTVAAERRAARMLTVAQTAALLHEAPAAYHTQVNDLLLTALVQTLAEWTREPALLLALEGHGREELAGGIDLSRTVGWFTSVFPVYLKLPAVAPEAGRLGDAIKSIKEQLRQIPNRGIGYGILRYLGGASALSEYAEPQVSFNYMGQFDQLGHREQLGQPGQLGELGRIRKEGLIIGPAEEPCGPEVGPRNARARLLDVTGIVVGGRLRVELTYSAHVHRTDTMERLATRYVEALTALIEHCCAPGSGGYTPSDFLHSGLDQEGLERAVLEIARTNQLPSENASPIDSIHPLAPSQQGMLFESLAHPASGRQIEQFLWQWQGSLNRTAYEQAFAQGLARHSALRTGFLWRELAEPLQFVLPEAALPVVWEDWRACTEAEQQQRLASLLAADREQGFDLSRVPLLRLRLIQLAEQRVQAVLTTHHILLDGWGLPIVLGEVHALYHAACAGRPLELAPVRPYSDYLAWLKEQDQAAAETFWRQRLQRFREPTLVCTRAVEKGDSEDAQDTSSGFGAHHVFIAPAVLEELRALARQSQVTLSTLLQGLWALLLGRYSGTRDVLFGITVSGRPASLPGVEAMVGLFINTVPLRVAVVPEQPFMAWLQALQDAAIEQQPFEHCAAGQIQQWSEVPAARRLYESLLVFENYPTIAGSDADRSFTLHEVHSVGAQTQYPLTVTVFPQQGLHVTFVYNRAAFAAHDVERLAAHLQVLLQRSAAAAGQPLAALLEVIPRSEIPAVVSAPAGPAAVRRFVPPLNAVEQALVHSWQTIFSLPSVSTHDNFYDLGGHSLLAMRLIGQIRQHFGLNLPISALLLNPTIVSLAAQIQAAASQSPEALFSALVPIQPSGSRPPFFLAPGAGGTVFYMYYMARYMDPEQPFYGLQAAGLDERSSPHITVEAMAGYFLSAIKRVQPHGPYYLGGHSFGSFIAYEMAQRLLRAGEEVACLILFDTEAPHLVSRLKHETDAQWIGEYVETFEEVLADKIEAAYEPPSSDDPEAQWTQFASWLRANKIMASAEEVATARQLLDVFKLQLTMEYRPKDVVPMRVILFRATDWEVDNRAEKMGWDALQVEPEMVLVPGNHMTFIGEPHVQVVAKKLIACLRNAQGHALSQ